MQNQSQQGRTSCSKPVTPGLRPGYDVAATNTIWNRRQIVERTYDWSHRSWVIATRSMVMFKTGNLRFQIGWYHERSYDRSYIAKIDRTIGRTMLRLIVRSIVASPDWLYHRYSGATIDRILRHRISRVLVRSVTVSHVCSYDQAEDASRPSRLIVHQSLIATTSRTISWYGSCHRNSPIVRDSATTRRDRSRYATAAGVRRNNCRSVAPWPNRNQSYDPEIVRSCVTVALDCRLPDCYNTHSFRWNALRPSMVHR